jgi:50S ribosomal protein L16 3-hydroxylase
LQAFSAAAVKRLLADPAALDCALGEVLSEPKRGVWFDTARAGETAQSRGVALDQRSRMMYDAAHVFVNGESFRAAGRDARLMRRLADLRHLEGDEYEQLSFEAKALLDDWLDAGWLRRGEAR